MSIRLAPLSLGKRLLRLSAQLSIRRPLLLLSALRLPLHCFKCPLHLAACLPACLPACLAVAADQRKWLNGCQPTVPTSVTVSCPNLARVLLNESYTRVWGPRGLVCHVLYGQGEWDGLAGPSVHVAPLLTDQHRSFSNTQFWETPKATHFSALASRLKPWSVFAGLCS